MIVTYVLSYLLLLLLHMHATASHEQKVCLGLGFLSGVLSLCFSFFSPFPFQPQRSQVISRLILSATIFRALCFLFLCACFSFPAF